MNSSDSLSDLLADFVFRDRRIADQDSLRTSVMMVEGDQCHAAPRGYNRQLGRDIQRCFASERRDIGKGLF